MKGRLIDAISNAILVLVAVFFITSIIVRMHKEEITPSPLSTTISSFQADEKFLIVDGPEYIYKAMRFYKYVVERQSDKIKSSAFTTIPDLKKGQEVKLMVVEYVLVYVPVNQPPRKSIVMILTTI